MAEIDEIRERLSAYSRTTHIQGYAGHEECEFLGNATDDVAFLLADLDRQSQRVAELEAELAGEIERRADVERERDEARRERDRLFAWVPTELVCGEWILSGQAEPDAVVTYASEPSPETGHVGWCWWARGKMGDASSYSEARTAAEASLREHARGGR